MIMHRLGGIMMPMVPAVATTPAASFLLYPLSLMPGMATIPMVAAVNGLDPETAAKAEQAKMELMASPPGSQLNHLRAAVKASSAIPETTMSSAMRTKSGATRKRKLELISKAICASWNRRTGSNHA